MMGLGDRSSQIPSDEDCGSAGGKKNIEEYAWQSVVCCGWDKYPELASGESRQSPFFSGNKWCFIRYVKMT